jgi:putative Mg2+ transporter-C (MgtC) family protein
MTGIPALDLFLDQFLADVHAPFGPIPPGTALARLMAAALLGGLIGLDREIRTKPAGLRTHMLIALAAALFALLAHDLAGFAGADAPQLRVDPLRLIEAVTAGVAFLAAGTIITGQGGVKGITTGAGMWMAGAIGLACGIGKLALAGLATLLALLILTALSALERWIG